MAALGFRTEDHPIRTQEVKAFTLRVAGRVSAEEVPELRSRILNVLDRQSEDRIVLALGQVESMDTAGAAVMVEAILRGRSAGKKVLICSPSPSVMRMFEMAGLEVAFEACCPTPDVTWQRLQH
ncbi:hypothetical protein ABI59_18145 [Acidobacteria bacterium Mor1]|nr:hypothetical protein ABI59_18145 [Acidobacteria bacterium Mor1]